MNAYFKYIVYYYKSYTALRFYYLKQKSIHFGLEKTHFKCILILIVLLLS